MFSKNTTISQDPAILSHEELLDEYEKISALYLRLKNSEDSSQQQIYESKQQLELSLKRESFLAQELETLTEAHEKELEKLQEKQRMEIDEIRKWLADSKETIAALEVELERMKSDKLLAEEVRAVTPVVAHVDETILNESHRVYLEKLEAENMGLIELCDEFKEKYLEVSKQVAERENEIENLKDRCACTEETLQSKRNDLEDKIQQLDNMQEKVFELNTQLAAYKTDASDMNKKGNSLFAEVDDQRQKMKIVLAIQKEHYEKMKKEHAEAQFEIRRLKRENAAMHREVKICGEMFNGANKYHKNKLNDRISYLNQQNELLTQKLKWTEEKLLDMATDKKITWLDSMLRFCKEETENLKKQLQHCRLQKAEAEDSYSNSKEEASKWRFEALKSRCIIIDREVLLEENKIPFQPLKNIDRLIKQKFKDIQKEAPQISDSPTNVQINREEAANAEKIQERSSSIQTHREAVYTVKIEESSFTFNNDETIDFIKSEDKLDIDLTSIKIEKEIFQKTESLSLVADLTTTLSLKTSPSRQESVRSPNLQAEKENISTAPISSQKTKAVFLQPLKTVEPKYRDIQMTPSRRNFLQTVSESVLEKTSPAKLSVRGPLKFPTSENEISRDESQSYKCASRSKIAVRCISSRKPSAWSDKK